MRNVHLREALLASLALALVAAGLAVDVRSRRPASAEVGAAGRSGRAGRFHERTVFCPGARGRGASRALSVHAPRLKGVRVSARPWRESPARPDGRMLWLKGADRRAVNVVGAGARVTATSVIGWRVSRPDGRRPSAPSGAGATGCSPVASDRWYFPLGASSAGWDERITILNPFPDTAVARVTFAPEQGREAGDPHEVTVAPRSSVQVEINRMVLPYSSLAAAVTVQRGRVVAWKTIFRSPRPEPSSRLARISRRPDRRRRPSPGGALFSLGATDTSQRWFFPEAGAGPGRKATLALMNPAGQPATATVSLLGREDIAQPPRLVDVTVPARGSTAIRLKSPTSRRGRVRCFSAVVTTDGARVVAERSMSYRTAELEGVASEIGARGPARRWSLAPAAAHPAADDVIVLNPGPDDAVLDLTVFRPSRRGLAPLRLQGLVLEGGGRRTIPVGGRRRGSPRVVLMRSSVPVVAERRAYSPGRRDVASVMGVPLPLGAG